MRIQVITNVVAQFVVGPMDRAIMVAVGVAHAFLRSHAQASLGFPRAGSKASCLQAASCRQAPCCAANGWLLRRPALAVVRVTSS